MPAIFAVILFLSNVAIHRYRASRVGFETEASRGSRCGRFGYCSRMPRLSSPQKLLNHSCHTDTSYNYTNANSGRRNRQSAEDDNKESDEHQRGSG